MSTNPSKSLISFKRNCPQCSKELTYTNENCFYICSGKNTLCRSCSQKGKVMSLVKDSTRLKMREAKLGTTFTAEHRENMSKSLRIYDTQTKLMISRHRACFRVYLQGRNIYFSKYIAIDLIGFRNYIESKFTPEMNWHNHGIIWELDHILPLNSFDLTKDANLYLAWNYTNFQPLLRTVHKRKGRKTLVN